MKSHITCSWISAGPNAAVGTGPRTVWRNSSSGFSGAAASEGPVPHATPAMTAAVCFRNRRRETEDLFLLEVSGFIAQQAQLDTTTKNLLLLPARNEWGEGH